MSQKEVIQYYESIAGDYDESRFGNSYGQFLDAEERCVLDKLIDMRDKGCRLDLACGTGRLTSYATHGLDASAAMMERARKRNPRVEFRLASACQTGYPEETFDLVYSFHFLMHVDEDTVRRVFDEVHRILKRGGRFILDIPSEKRRRLFRHKQSSWHGGTALSSRDIERMIAGKYLMGRRFGLMMMPVHRLSVKVRRPLQKVDFLLANSWLKEYSSYLVFELVKV